MGGSFIEGGNTWILAALFMDEYPFLLEGLKVTVEVSLFSIILVS